MKHKMDPKDIFEFKMNSGSYKVCYFVFWHLLIRQQLTGFFCLQVPIFLVFFLAPASPIGSNALLSSRILASNKSFGHLSTAHSRPTVSMKRSGNHLMGSSTSMSPSAIPAALFSKKAWWAARKSLYAEPWASRNHSKAARPRFQSLFDRSVSRSSTDCSCQLNRMAPVCTRYVW